MKNYYEQLIKFFREKGVYLLEVINQYFFKILFFVLFFNFALIGIIFYNKYYFVSFVLLFSVLVLLLLSYLIQFHEINLYDRAQNKLLFLNVVLLFLNIINIFFNVFRYLFYDIIKFVREYVRNIFLDYFKVEIISSLDYYIDNIVAYVSFNVVWTSIIIVVILIWNIVSYTLFDWSEERVRYLKHNDEFQKKHFWVYKNDYILASYMFSWIWVRIYVLVPIIHYNIHPIGFYFQFWATFLFFVSLFNEIILESQFFKQYFKYYLKKNKEWKKL